MRFLGLKFKGYRMRIEGNKVIFEVELDPKEGKCSEATLVTEAAKVVWGLNDPWWRCC